MTPLSKLLALLAALFGGAAIGYVVPHPAPTPTPPPVVQQPAPTPTPTPSPTPTPPETTATSVSGPGLSGKAFVSDNFSEYTNTAALQANISSTIGGTGNYQTVLYNDGYNGQLASIDPSVKYNGHQTLKYTFPGGVQTYPGLWVNFSNKKTLTHLWYRVKIRFSPGFSTTGVLVPPAPNSANAYKLLGWGWDTYDGSGRVEITNTNQYYVYWAAITKSGTGIGGGPDAKGGTVVNEWSDGGWYDYIVECDFSQGKNGVARVWMAKDGQTPVLRATSSGSFNNGASLPGLTTVMLGLNFNQTRAASQTQYLWYGQWEVVDGVAHPDPFGLGIK